MNELTFAYKDEAFTDSVILSDGVCVEHRAVLQLISKYKDDLSEFGRVAFEMRPFETNGGVQKMRVCRLNEQQATFLISLMKNTKPVVAFKKELVRQFFQMREYISEIVTARNDFPELTDAVRLAHEKPMPYHYSNECDMLNRLVLGMSAKQFRETHGIEKGKSIRPYMSADQIKLIDKLQKVDVGLLVAIPDYEERKKHLERYIEQTSVKAVEVA